jgi:large repetitive protein
LDTLTGVISGIPTIVSASANYTMTATGPGGSALATVNITVIDQPPTISYRNAAVIYARNQVAAPDSIILTGGAVTRYAVSPALPSGLALDTNTGVISGTPTGATASTNYIVTATGPGGSDTALVNIRVVSAPANLSYSDDPVTYVVGVASSSNIPTVSGYVTHYSIIPVLSAGMLIDTVTGIISGTPTSQSFATDYTVTASSFAGSTQYTLNITVVGAPVNLSYEDDVPTYQVGVSIAPPDRPTVRGIVTNYSILPPLPPGVILDQTTGYILGTPLSSSSGTDYTITASNPGGSTTVTINLTVVAP